jgi:hypothetical protein
VYDNGYTVIVGLMIILLIVKLCIVFVIMINYKMETLRPQFGE